MRDIRHWSQNPSFSTICNFLVRGLLFIHVLFDLDFLSLNCSNCLTTAVQLLSSPVVTPAYNTPQQTLLDLDSLLSLLQLHHTSSIQGYCW